MSHASTAVELESRPPAGPATPLPRRPVAPPSPRPEDAAEEDDVLATSRIADAAVPDGGYGWVVVACGAVLSWWAIGTTYAWGVMQTALVDRGLSTPAVLSFIGGLNASLVSALAIANSRLIRRFGLRAMSFLGVLCLGGSEVVSSFAVDNLGALFFTAGLWMGTGVSISFLVASTVPVQYFHRKRGLATGLISSGAGVGGAVMSFALDALITSMGVAWAYRVLGLATLCTGLPAAWFMKERTAPSVAPRLIEWQLFRSLTFVLIFLAGVVGTFPLFVTPFFLPQYTKSLGFASEVGAGLAAGFSLSSAVGRVLCGLACDRLGALNTLVASCFLTGLSMLAIWPASTTLGPLVLFVIVNGVSNGGFFATFPTVVASVFGSARVATALGMILTGWIGGYLMGSPIAGYLLEAYGGAEGGLEAFRPAMFYAGSLGLASCGLLLGARLRRNRSLLARV